MRKVLSGLLIVCLVSTTSSVDAWSFRNRVATTTKLPGRHGATTSNSSAPPTKHLEIAAADASEWMVPDSIVAVGKLPRPPHWSNTLARPLLAEFIGTFIIVQFGLGAVMSAIFGGALVGLFQIAAVWGIAVTLAIYCTAHISGAHLNPSITLAFALLRQFSWKKVIPYMMAQLSGATCAAWMSLSLYSSTIRSYKLTNNIVRASAGGVASAKAFGEYFSSPVTIQTAFLGEAFGTALLAFVIFALTHPRNDSLKDKDVHIPPLIGLCVAGLICVIAPINQAGFNPAPDFGPRIVAWLAGWKSVAFSNWWVYVLGPIVGAPVGAFLADRVLFATDNESGVSKKQ